MHIKKTVWVYFNKTLLPERDGGREGGSEGASTERKVKARLWLWLTADVSLVMVKDYMPVYSPHSK